MLAFFLGDLKLYRKLSGGHWYYVSLKEFPNIKLWVRRCGNVADVIKEEHY